MKLGELKKSLTRFSPDMDDCEVIFTHCINGKTEYDNLAFIAYSEIPEENVTVVVLGSMTAAVDRMKKGTLKTQDGKQITKEGYDLSSGQGN